MESYIFWTVMLAVLAVLGAGAAVFVRAYLGGTSPSALLFKPKAERRLEVVDYAALDSRRKLVLIRRDDVEHLLMTGGPVDVVIETGITTGPRPAVATPGEPAAARRTPQFGLSKGPADPPPGLPQL
jgi:flagellar protein FliO/FliZ